MVQSFKNVEKDQGMTMQEQQLFEGVLYFIQMVWVQKLRSKDSMN